MFQLKYRLQEGEDGGEGGGGGDAGAGDANQGDANNADGNLISHDTLWQPNESEGNANEGANNQPVGNQQQVDPNAAFQTHIDSLDFGGEIDLSAGMEAIRNGDVEVFGKLLNQVGINAYKNAMVDANKVVQQRVDKMGEQVQNNVSANQSTGELVREMGSQLPFTKSPAYAPVAKLVLTQFLEKGDTPAAAIENVGKYFKNLSGEVSQLNPGAPSGRPSGNFGGNSSNRGDGNSSEEADWVKILGGPVIQ